MRMISVDSAIWHLHSQPAPDGVKTPKVVMASEKVVTPLAQLFLFHASLLCRHLRFLKTMMETMSN
jgi:hypothetical protein